MKQAKVLEPKKVLFDAIIHRPNNAIKSFYYDKTTFERVDARREFYIGDIVHVTEVVGNEGDPGGMLWEIQGRNTEKQLYRVWIQPMTNNWARKDSQVVRQVIAPNDGQAPELDPALYTSWLFVTRQEGVEVWPEDGKGSGYITIVPSGYVFKHIQQPNFYEVEWQGHSAFVEPNYVAPALSLGKYYYQMTKIKWEPMQDPDYNNPEPEPVKKWWQIIWDWIVSLWHKIFPPKE